VVQYLRVLIHGHFQRRVQLRPDELETAGFYTTTRWLVAVSNSAAVNKAFRSAERELQHRPEIRDGFVGINMEAEEVDAGSWWRSLRGGGRGFAFLRTGLSVRFPPEVGISRMFPFDPSEISGSIPRDFQQWCGTLG
jgi:hypothetical protein